MIPFLLAGAAALAALRTMVVRRHERAVARRLPIGPDGIIPGAASIAIDVAGAETAVLILHGFGDTPHSVRHLAADLAAAGYAVRAPLLPGHGRTLPAFARSRASEWLAAARAARDALMRHHARVAIVGQSMGGALAVLLAAERAPAALVLLAPYLEPSAGVARIAAWPRLTTLAAPYVGASGGEQSIHDPEERAASLGYGVTSPGLLAELAQVAVRARAALGELRAPTLVVHSREDHRITPAAAERGYARLGAPVRRLEWLTGCGHVLAVDRERARVSALVREWLGRHAPAGRAVSGDPAGCGETGPAR